MFGWEARDDAGEGTRPYTMLIAGGKGIGGMVPLRRREVPAHWLAYVTVPNVDVALDKVKTGNFNMVKIYLEGLTPRIDKQWEKLGKKPKKLERELVKMEEIRAELKRAQEEREKYVAEREAEGGEKQPEEKKAWG